MTSRNLISRWSGLRPWQILQPRVSSNNARRHPVEIWGLLEELMGEGPYRVTRLGEPGFSQLRFILEEDEDLWGDGEAIETRLRDLIASRSLEMDESQVRPIDTRAVFAKCRTEVYKPKSRCLPVAGRSATMTTGQEDCPVCLEKFVADQVLYRIPCNHLFHKDCLTPWIQSNHGDCPCCRAQILASPTTATANNSRRDFPSRSSGNNHNTTAATSSGSNGRRETDDIMSVLSAMETAIESLGFRTY